MTLKLFPPMKRPYSDSPLVIKNKIELLSYDDADVIPKNVKNHLVEQKLIHRFADIAVLRRLRAGIPII